MQQNDTWRRCSPAGLDIQRLHRKPVVFEQSQLYPAACMASSRRTCPRLLLLGGPFGRSHIAAVSRRLIRSSRSAPPQGAATLRRDGGPGRARGQRCTRGRGRSTPCTRLKLPG